MSIFEYDEERHLKTVHREGFEDGYEEGLATGREEGEGMMARLMTILLEKGLVSEAEKAAVDQSTRNELYRKYHLIQD